MLTDLEFIVRSEVSATEKDKYHMISLLYVEWREGTGEAGRKEGGRVEREIRSVLPEVREKQEWAEGTQSPFQDRQTLGM